MTLKGLPNIIARLAKWINAADLRSALRRQYVGSNPAPGIGYNVVKCCGMKHYTQTTAISSVQKAQQTKQVRVDVSGSTD